MMEPEQDEGTPGAAWAIIIVFALLVWVVRALLQAADRSE